MTRRDKREIGAKEYQPYRKGNLPASQIRGPKIPPGAGRSSEIPMARGDENYVQLTITFDDEPEPYDD